MARIAKHNPEQVKAFLAEYATLKRGTKEAWLKEKELTATTIAAYKRRIEALEGKAPKKAKKARKAKAVAKNGAATNGVIEGMEAVTVTVPAASGSLPDVQRQVAAIVAQLGGSVEWATA